MTLCAHLLFRLQAAPPQRLVDRLRQQQQEQQQHAQAHRPHGRPVNNADNPSNKDSSQAEARPAALTATQANSDRHSATPTAAAAEARGRHSNAHLQTQLATQQAGGSRLGPEVAEPPAVPSVNNAQQQQRNQQQGEQQIPSAAVAIAAMLQHMPAFAAYNEPGQTLQLGMGSNSTEERAEFAQRLYEQVQQRQDAVTAADVPQQAAAAAADVPQQAASAAEPDMHQSDALHAETASSSGQHGLLVAPRRESGAPSALPAQPHLQTVTVAQEAGPSDQQEGLPQEQTAAPEQQAVVPEQQAVLPEQHALAPEQETVLPEQPAVALEQHAAVQVQPAIVPQQQALVPRQNAVQRALVLRQPPRVPQAQQAAVAVNDEPMAFEELVGLRGPIRLLFENAGTVIFSSAMFMAAALWAPFTWGRITISGIVMTQAAWKLTVLPAAAMQLLLKNHQVCCLTPTARTSDHNIATMRMQMTSVSADLRSTSVKSMHLILDLLPA